MSPLGMTSEAAPHETGVSPTSPLPEGGGAKEERGRNPPLDQDERRAARVLSGLHESHAVRVAALMPATVAPVVLEALSRWATEDCHGLPQGEVHAAIDAAIVAASGRKLQSPGAYLLKVARSMLADMQDMRARANLDASIRRAQADAKLAELQAETDAHVQIQRERPAWAECAARSKREANNSKASGGSRKAVLVTDEQGQPNFDPVQMYPIAVGITLPGATLLEVRKEFPEASVEMILQALVDVDGRLTGLMNARDGENRRARVVGRGDAVTALRTALIARLRDLAYAKHGAPESKDTAAYSHSWFAISRATLESWKQSFPLLFADEASQHGQPSQLFDQSRTLREATRAATTHATAHWRRYGNGLQEEVHAIFVASLKTRELHLASVEKEKGIRAAQLRDEKKQQEAALAKASAEKLDRERMQAEISARGMDLGVPHDDHWYSWQEYLVERQTNSSAYRS
jgi:hypothetical protein